MRTACSRAMGSCSHRRSSTRTCTCARPDARTKRRSRAGRLPRQPAARPALRGGDAFAGRADARGRGLGRARVHRLPLGGGEPDGRARPCACRVRAAAAAPPAPFGMGVGAGAPPRAGRRRRGDGGGHASSPVPHRRGRALARSEREEDPAAPRRVRPDRPRRGTEGRHDHCGRDRPRAARSPRKGRAVRGRAVRRHRARDGVRRALHAPGRARGRPAGDDPGADVGRAGPRLRARRAAHRGRQPGESRPARPEGELSHRRGIVPLALGQLVAPRPDGQGRSTDDDRGGTDGVRGMSGFLALEDGTVFRGESVAADGFAVGEAVFTTAMTGYQEIVTDPSFAEQLICFTAPMVGNYGVAEGRSESPRPHARAVLMREARGPAWTDWLHERGLVALSGIDTRSLVLKLRAAGAMRAVVVAGEGSTEQDVAVARAQEPMAGRALAPAVSTPRPYVYSDAGRMRIAVVDYGCKRSILRRLAGAGAAVTVFPHDATADELARFDGVLLSNGPGDPEPLSDEVAVVRELLGRVPILGICLGHQLLALAAGHETFKLPFRHRGANHPVLDKRSNRVLVTSQNHGFAVAPSAAKEATHVSLYDGTVEGLDFPELKARSVQFHPEARPGPHDAWPLLSSWVQEVSLAQAA